jgi:tRNA-specific 2-thiouridylase
MVAMSGGVDSSAAAAKMVEAGHEVFGLTMKLRDTGPDEGDESASCCSPSDIRDARAACDVLGIAHYVVDYRETFKRTVVQPFAESYLAGETPNPCVACNDHVKFASLIERAQDLGCDLMATGHYALLADEPGEGWVLRKGVDDHKDQSYFLFGLKREVLPMVRFPLGGMNKPDVRAYAERLGLPNARKPDSEDICFVPSGNYGDVVERLVGAERVPQAGQIVDEAGNVLGSHRGIHRYTVGQRKGLNIKGSERMFVLGVDAAQDTLVVGPSDRLLMQGLEAHRCHWLVDPSVRPVTARIRYRHAGVAATIMPLGDTCRVWFDTPERAVAPGQAVVFYDGDRVLGGGWIRRALRAGEDDG